MKVAPLWHALKEKAWAEPCVVHTGQHYDVNMSDSFFRDLDLPAPHFHLGVGSGSHAEQTGKVMMEYEKVCLQEKPDLVVVVGDVNSTVACSLAAVKLGIKVAHLEAGLRSFDRRMPEEINRIVTDSIVDLLWTPSPDGDEHLLHDGIAKEKIARVGNIMLDSFEMLRSKIEADKTAERLGVEGTRFGLITLHRPSNVDSPETLASLVELLLRASEMASAVFPIHPRTKKNLEAAGLYSKLKGKKELVLTEPLPYLQFMNLLVHASFVLTDSGGIQEESTYLGVPCLTLRENTERPITVTQGTNKLTSIGRAVDDLKAVLSGGSGRKKCTIDLWDGKTAGRVVRSIETFLGVA